jgi:Cryptococcal mannosyltransferase 1
VYGDHLPLDDFPSIVTPEGEARVKRLTYLEEVRNRLLWPLDKPSAHPGSQTNFTSTKFDRILFINDVFFEPIDALQLLFSTHLDPETRLPDYRAACAADFINHGLFYDSFVVRDSEGYGMGFQFFPWFATVGSAKSREAVLAESDAVPVKSCWGGMIAYEAEEFLRPEISSTSYSSEVRSSVQKHGPLRFRHQPEIYWEESECCLLNADLAARTDPANPKFFLNPYIRVAYTEEIWTGLSFVRRVEHVFTYLQYIVSKIGFPEFNPRRTEIAGKPSAQLRWVYDDDELNGEKIRDFGTIVPSERLKGNWKMTEQIATPGGFCGQRRLFLMQKDLENANEAQTGRNWVKGPFPRVK